MRPPPVPLAAALAFLALPVLAGDAVEFRVVVPADHPMSSISRQVLSDVFLGKIGSWEDGTPAAPVDQLAESPVRAAFASAIHGRSTSAVASFWQRQDYAGRGPAPPEVASDDEVLEFVERSPGAVGYVSASLPLDARFRVLEVFDVEDVEEVAVEDLDPSSAPAGGSAAAAAGDETVARHGDLRLFLTGSCGPADEGRQAVLENRSGHHRVEATIETSVWEGGWFRASSVDRHALEPLQEERLGCTRRSDGERRYAIVEASSASSMQTVAGDLGREGPAREALAIVGAGTCGSGRRGEWRSLLNRHPWRQIAVRVETRETVDGAVRRRYQKRYRLAPGATRRLGCSADGATAREFTLLEAEYR